jgi:hypothetical protein
LTPASVPADQINGIAPMIGRQHLIQTLAGIMYFLHLRIMALA